MKRNSYVALSMLIIAFFGCNKSDLVHENEFDKSYKKWVDFKRANHDSYHYIVRSSSWVGSNWETDLVIQGGDMVERRFHYTSYQGISMPETGWDLSTAQKVIDSLVSWKVYKEGEMLADDFIKEELSWVEHRDQLNSHPKSQSPAAVLWTLDQVYEEAKNNWLKKRDRAETYFEANNDGLLSSCGYVESGCFDDCFRGIHIDVIEPL